MATHTPKPWTTNGHSIGVSKGTVATMYRPGDSTCRGLTQAEQEANAELIAAAPDLLDAARAAVGFVAAWAAHLNDSGKSVASYNAGKAAEDLRAAISKAERGTR